MRKISFAFSLLLVFASCSQPDFRFLEPSVKNGVTVEAKFWRGTFDPKGGFELRITNSSNADLPNCVLIFDGNYKHTVEGLYSQEKGLLKDTVFHKGEQITLQFGHDYSNLQYFDIKETSYMPKEITLKSDNTEVKYKLEQ